MNLLNNPTPDPPLHGAAINPFPIAYLSFVNNYSNFGCASQFCKTQSRRPSLPFPHPCTQRLHTRFIDLFQSYFAEQTRLFPISHREIFVTRTNTQNTPFSAVKYLFLCSSFKSLFLESSIFLHQPSRLACPACVLCPRAAKSFGDNADRLWGKFPFYDRLLVGEG